MQNSKEIAVRFLQAFWAGKPAEALALCAPEALWTFQKSLRPERQAPVPEAIDFLMTRLVSGFDPDSGYTVDLRNAIGEGGEAAVEYGASGRTKDGGIYANDYLVRFTVRDGLICSIRPYFDTHYVHRTLAPLD
jgi:ketosteroid isomerase-like protein